MPSGYYRYPTLYGENLVFASEGDLWKVSVAGGIPQRLTAEGALLSHPHFSPDGKYLAFTGTLEGHSEVYVMASEGGPIRRLTYLGDLAQVIGWTQTHGILFTSSHDQPFSRFTRVFSLQPDFSTCPHGGIPQVLPVGPASFASFGAVEKGTKQPTVIQRHGYREFSFWKRYRGGTAGDLWIDRAGEGVFEKLISLKGNLSRPHWIGDRIYFGADHEDIGNIYSCTLNGQDLKRHTHHNNFYIRNQTVYEHKIVYHAGADLYVLDLEKDTSVKVNVDYKSPRNHRNRKFISPQKYLEDYDLHPKGHSLAATARGKAFQMGNFKGPVLQVGEEAADSLNCDEGKTTRHRLARWLHCGKRLLLVVDQNHEETLCIYDKESLECVFSYTDERLGRITELKVSPTKDQVVLTNHRHEIIFVCLETKTLRVLDRSAHSDLGGFDWSPDGRWVVYSCSLMRHTMALKLINIDVAKSEPITITKPVLKDTAPVFDPEGRFIYFISHRQFNPSHDTLHFELGFPQGMRPYLLTLRADEKSPFLGEETDSEEEDEVEAATLGKSEGESSDAKSSDEKESEKDAKKEECPEPLQIDFEGIEDRILPFPVSDGVYGQILPLKDKVLFTSYGLEGALSEDAGDSDDDTDTCDLEYYSFSSQKSDTLIEGLSHPILSLDRSTMMYLQGHNLRAVKAGEKPDTDTQLPRYSKTNGWVNLGRAKIMVAPYQEWAHMFYEAWRLQKDHFWVEDMSSIDWEAVKQQYAPLLDRIGTREEFSDLLWEMQGELGTSHAYVMGGDIKRLPHYGIGLLGANLAYDDHEKAYRITHITKGDPWRSAATSPLLQPGINVKTGDFISAIGGRPLSKNIVPGECLLNLAGQDVRLTVKDHTTKETRHVTVKTLRSSTASYYRDWVNKNREHVHKKTNGRVGYVHIPDMGVQGFSEFHRGYLAESDREGLVIDVRFNGGGSVSPLLLEKLARRRLGYDITRWHGTIPYPEDSPAGPMVALTNEYAGSDGDIFSHSFKMMKLGPLIGKRTWGGVIGIWPRYSLIDGAMTTQPEFSFWFKDVGWAVENYGVDPDIEVEYEPQDYQAGKDPQLDRGIAEVLKIMERTPEEFPDVAAKPSLRRKKLA